MKKVLFLVMTIIMVLLACPVLAATFLSECAVDGRVLETTYLGNQYYTDTIDCSEDDNAPASCSLNLNVYEPIAGTYYNILPISFSCDNNIITLDGIQCFYYDSQVLCPLLDKPYTQITVDGIVYRFSPDVKFLQFDIK